MIENVIPHSVVDSVCHATETVNEKAAAAYKEEGTSVITYLQSFAPYLAHDRVLDVITNIFNHPHVRIAQTELKIRQPHTSADPNVVGSPLRAYHSDWPHDLRDLSESGHLRQPFPDIVMSIVTLWMLSPFHAENGATWIVPRSHRSIRNPRGNDGISVTKPIPNEIQATGNAGSVLMMDSRIWHTAAPNETDYSRVAILARYVPWWLSVELGKRNQATIPADVLSGFPEAVQALYQHRTRT